MKVMAKNRKKARGARNVRFQNPYRCQFGGDQSKHVIRGGR